MNDSQHITKDICKDEITCEGCDMIYFLDANEVSYKLVEISTGEEWYYCSVECLVMSN